MTELAEHTDTDYADTGWLSALPALAILIVLMRDLQPLAL
jgi:hypothetical protein